MSNFLFGHHSQFPKGAVAGASNAPHWNPLLMRVRAAYW